MMNTRDFFYRYQRIVVFDTEFTTWEGAHERDWSGEYEHREVVQIAAQLVDLTHEMVVDTYQCVVKPRVNVSLSDYFQELTGITQATVDAEGVDFFEMYEEFTTWAKGCDKYAYNRDENKPADVAVLQENIALYELPLQLDASEYGNLAAVYQGVGIDTQRYNSGKLYQAFGLHLDGHEHNAMHDVDSLVQSLFATRRILLGSATV